MVLLVLEDLRWPVSAGCFQGVFPSTFEFSTSIIILSAVILGGIGNPYGALLGGLILGVCETLAAGYVSSAMKNAVSFLLIFIILVFEFRSFSHPIAILVAMVIGVSLCALAVYRIVKNAYEQLGGGK